MWSFSHYTLLIFNRAYANRCSSLAYIFFRFASPHHRKFGGSTLPKCDGLDGQHDFLVVVIYNPRAKSFCSNTAVTG